MKTQTKGKTKIDYTPESIRLKAFRKFIKLSQVEIAEVLGVHQTMVYKYENAINIIPFEVAKILHAKFELSYEWFYDGTGPMKGNIKRSSLVTDTNHLQGEIEQLKNEVKGLKKQMMQLAKDFYAKRAGTN